MLKKILTLLFLLLFSLAAAGAQAPACAAGQESPSTLTGEIFAFYQNENGAEGVQELLDGYLADTAGETAEWFVWGLRQYEGSYSFSAYSAALEQYLAQNNVTNASTREKYALTLLASGSDSPYIAETADSAIGGMGVMSYVFGLHLLNNGVASANWTTQSVIAALLELAHEDGGWSIRADASLASDIDVTAMAIQSLAPHRDQSDTSIALNKALDYLSQKQTEYGDYSAFGGRNAESSAQVLIALASLGIDPYTDARFIKDGKTVVDGLLRYRLEDGKYSHFEGENYSLSATQQAFAAYVALWRLQQGKSSYYALDDYVFAVPTEPARDGEDTTGTAFFASWKLWTAFGISAAAIVVILILLVTKRGGLKEGIACALIAVLCIGVLTFCDIQSKDEYYNRVDPIENAISVTVSISCDTLIGQNNPYVPTDGVILSPCEIEVEEGGTVFDALSAAVRVYVIQMEYKGGFSSGATYISGIHYLYEFDYGELSGWMYAVNEITPGLGCAEYTLSDGDSILWYYTLDLGRDAGVYGVEGGL